LEGILLAKHKHINIPTMMEPFSPQAAWFDGQKYRTPGSFFARGWTSMAALERICARMPTPQAAWVHQIHTAGGTSGSNTMVILFVMVFMLFVRVLTHDLPVVLFKRTF
jgi:hypothetical protein